MDTQNGPFEGFAAKNEFCRQTVSESDIDWLLCVELNSNDAFRCWFGGFVFPGRGPLTHICAVRSERDVLGESDLLWWVRTENGQELFALAENKINAPPQPAQYQRYVRRGEKYRRNGKCDHFEVVLISPKGYRSTELSAFKNHLSYEEIRDWFSNIGTERSIYISGIFSAAIKKLGSLAPPDQQVTEFRQRIWELARAEYPNLNVPRPKPVSATQYWVYMRYDDFMIIYKMFKEHGKFGQCVVDLTLPGRGADVQSIRSEYRNDLEGTDISVEQTEQSAAFRIEVPRVVPPIFDESGVRAALCAASRLLQWWQKVSR